MSSVGLLILYALFLWWFATGVILYLDGLPRSTFRWSMLGMSVVAAAALYGLWATSGVTTVHSAVCAFTCALLVWGWHEMSFLMGFVTGPRAQSCPPGSAGLARAALATQTILFHELAIAVTFVALLALCAGGGNQTGVWTFGILWALRLSAKLNVFLGVANLAEEFLPAHLHYLGTYFRRRPMNLLFPVSVTAATAATLQFVLLAAAPDIGAYDLASMTFLATLTALGLIEHWFMVLPMPATALWAWGLRSHAREARAAAAVKKLGQTGENFVK